MDTEKRTSQVNRPNDDNCLVEVIGDLSICVVSDIESAFMDDVLRRFSDLAIDFQKITPETLETKSFRGICQIFNQSKNLIVFFTSAGLDGECVSSAVEYFERHKRSENVVPLFLGDDFDAFQNQTSPLIESFGNKIIECKGFSPDEIFDAICARIHGLKVLQEARGLFVPPEKGSHDTFFLRNSSVKIIRGNILDSKCDVLVSSDDNLITHGGGVSKTIFSKGGSTIKNDAEKCIPADLGDVIVTSAGSLNQRYIFHAITIDLTGKEKNCLCKEHGDDIQNYIVSNAVQRSFYLLSSLQQNSIAFPVIGTGVAKIPFDKAVHCMLSMFAEQIQKTAKPLCVELWIYGHDDVDVSAIAKEVFAQTIPVQKLSSTDFAQPTYDIFISYSRRDKEKVKEITDFLKEKGLHFWIDSDGVHSGDSYKKSIIQAICQSQILLFLSSKESNKSENVVKEISNAVGMGKKIIPVKIDLSSYSYEIAYDIQHLDFIDMVNDESAYSKLYYSILSKLDR